MRDRRGREALHDLVVRRAEPFIASNVARPRRDVDDIVRLVVKKARHIRRVSEVNRYRVDSKPRQAFRYTVANRAYDAVPRLGEVFGGVRADVSAGTCDKNRFHLL